MENLTERELERIIEGLTIFLKEDDIYPSKAKRYRDDALFTIIDSFDESELDNLPKYGTAAKIVQNRHKRDPLIFDKYERFL